MTSTDTVHAPAANAPLQTLDITPTVATRSRITSDAEIRFWAYCRSSSCSKAGLVAPEEVRRSRASRTCWVARRRFTGELSGGRALRSGFSPGTGIDVRRTYKTPAAALRKILKTRLKTDLKSLVNKSFTGALTADLGHVRLRQDLNRMATGTE